MFWSACAFRHLSLHSSYRRLSARKSRPVRYFFARNSPADFSSAGCFRRLECRAFRSGISPRWLHSPSGSCSNSARKVPRGRVMSHRTSASVFPRRLKRICSSSPIRTRSFFFCLSSEMTNKIVFVIFVCLNTRSNNII